MNILKIILTLVFFLGFLSQAADPQQEISFSLTELKNNQTVAMTVDGEDDQVPVAAARVIQLQLEATGCKSVIVVPGSLTAKKDNTFTVSSENCLLKKKVGEMCDPGSLSRVMAQNPNVPKGEDDVVIGLNTYKVCVKDAGTAPKKSKVAN